MTDRHRPGRRPIVPPTIVVPPRRRRPEGPGGWLADRAGSGPDGLAIAVIASAVALIAGVLVGAALAGPIGDNAKDVLIAGIGGLLGLLTGVSVAFLGFRNAKDSELARFQREDQYRFAADKQTAFSHLLGVGDAARTSAETAAGDPVQRNINVATEKIDQLSVAQEAAALLGAMRVDDAVGEYVDALIAYYNLMLELADETPAARRKSMQPQGRWDVAQDLVFDRRLKAIDAMRADLGLTRGGLG